MHVDPIEWLWIALNGTTFAVTVLAWREARRDRAVVQLKDGRVREIATDGHVRRETVRGIIQVLLLALVVPGLFIERPVPLTFPVAVLMGIASMVFVNTVGDYRDMRRITAELYRDLGR